MSRINRKNQIISAALELFRRKGLADVSARHLAVYHGLLSSCTYHYLADWKILSFEALELFLNEKRWERRADQPPQKLCW